MRVSLPGVVLASVVGLFVGSACHRSFVGTVRQPNPLLTPTEVSRTSQRITIVTGDMELRMPQLPQQQGVSGDAALYRSNRYPLINQATFMLVSRDRLRFHVQLDHKWEDWADLRSWDVELVDDQGNKYKPETTERARTRLMVTMWDNEVRTPIRNRYGDVIGLHNDGWRNRVPLGSLAVFRGNADFVFYRRDIFRPDIKWLQLKVARFGVDFQFKWQFAPESATKTVAVH